MMGMSPGNERRQRDPSRIRKAVWLCGALLMGGCGMPDGAGRVFTFHALGPGDSIAPATAPVARGTVLELSIVDAAGRVQVARAFVEPAGVLELVRVGNPTAVRALRVGEAELTVVATDGRTDKLALRVAEPDSVKLSASLDLGPFGAWTNAGIPDEHLPAGLVLLGDASVIVRAELRDASARRMLGYYGASAWNLSGPDVVELTYPFERQEAVRVRPVAGGSGQVVLHAHGTRLPLEVTDVAKAAQLLVRRIGSDADPPATVELTLADFSHDTASFIVQPIDAANRALLGNGDHGVTALVEQADVAQADVADPHIVILKARGRGTTRLQIAQLGGTVELPVRVD